MQTKFTKYINYTLLLVLLCVISASTFLTSCDKDEEGDNGITVLSSYGPMPVARGAELRFIGKNLDKVTSIILPGNIEIAASEFGTKTATLLTITVPQNAVEGVLTLVTPDGNIETKTPMGFSEPISIASFGPTTIKQDSILTITGDYLNLVNEIIFTDRLAVGDTAFITHTRYQISLPVPAKAQTGKIAVSTGGSDPIIVYSTTNLNVRLPIIGTITPNPVKAGNLLTITGNHLDIVTNIIVGGNKNVSSFVSKQLGQIQFVMPIDAKDGKVIIQPASGISVESESDLIMVVPAVSVSPTTLKNGEDITVTGTNLDLVSKVIFGGGKEGTIKAGGTATQILVTVPDDAIDGVVEFVTKAEKTVHGPTLTMVSPTFTSFAPSSAKPKTDIVITGTDLDLVTKVMFVGDKEGTIGTRSLTQLTVTIPVGAKNGKITLITKNGQSILSPSDITILANLPNISSFSEPSGLRGKILTINGTNMSLIKQLIFPGNIVATAYGLKSDTKVEVYVPTNTPYGYGNIRLVTYEGEEGLSPEIYIGGIDPVYNQTLCFFNFNGSGKDSWWGNAIASGISNDAALSADGSPFWRVNGMGGTGWWDGLFFRNGNDNFVTTGVDVNNWVVKFDINVLEAIKEGDLRIRFGNFYYHFQPWNGVTDGFKTVGWITVSCPLTDFKKDDGTVLSNPSDGGAEFGMIWCWGTAVKVNMCIDNLRFEPK